MVLPDLIHVCAIFVVAIHFSDSCTETYAYSGDANVRLIFDINWTKVGASDIPNILCYKEDAQIGNCQRILGAILCGTSNNDVSGMYEFSSNEDFTAVYITIRSFNERTEGQYYCFPENYNSQRTSICLQTLVNLTALTLHPQTNVTYPVYKEQSVFTCITSASRPGARIHWFVADRNITDMASYTYSSYVATSILRYTPDSITSEELRCTASYLIKSTNITMQRRTNMTILCKYFM
ncbi:uncharacterized protein LOC127854134 [Dreissena polymorpha]|uniref:uncharacterized protein LOC127854134 n=1 Tax=Dreissena polymorpha TaxID=45954 RepID=UPI002263F3DC|nr:uncharacterized protein LOC127854134 [Dreissena polymorpha]